MKPVQRHDNWLDYIWALTRALYYFLGLPSLVFIALASIVIYSSKGPTEPGAGMGIFFTLVWFGILFPLGYRRLNVMRRRRQLKKMVAQLSSAERFSPQKQHQITDAGRGKFLGVDTRTGNVLYIHIVKKGLVDVLGLTMRDWTDGEREAGTLRVSTKNPDVPELSINAHPGVARELLNTLGAMSHNAYPESFPQEPWPEYVGRQSRFVEYEHNVVVPQVV